MGILIIDSILKYYDNKIILSDISFEIKSSEIFTIFGRNGSGKTTLVNAILGLEKCDYIFRKYNGKIINNNVRYLFSYSSQKIFIPDYIKIRQLLKLFNIDNSELIKNDILILKKIDFKFKELSYGERFYIQLFLVIHSKKKICILDEPFSGLSPFYINNIIKYIKRNYDKIFIITDHNIEALFEVGNRKAFLKNGKLINIDDKILSDIKEMYYSII